MNAAQLIDAVDGAMTELMARIQFPATYAMRPVYWNVWLRAAGRLDGALALSSALMSKWKRRCTNYSSQPLISNAVTKTYHIEDRLFGIVTWRENSASRWMNCRTVFPASKHDSPRSPMGAVRFRRCGIVLRRRAPSM